MKLTILLILTIFAFASCDTKVPFFYKLSETAPAPQDHSKMDHLRSFYTTLFNQFNLSRPDQIFECFCDKSVDLFFDSLYDTHQILIDTNERNSIKLHIEFAKFMLTYGPLHDIFACISMTQDFTDFLDALNIKERNPKEFMISKYVYYQAEYPVLLNDFKSVIDGLDNKNHSAAGEAYANVIGNLVQAIKEEGLNFLAYEGFQNGIAVKLDLNNPRDILGCWNSESAGYYLEFLYKWSEAVTDGNWRDVSVNSNRFWEEHGRQIMEKIPEETLECVASSSDNQQITQLLGIDVESMEFLNLMLKYVEEHRFHFFVQMKGLRKSFDHFNLNHAGYIYGHFLEQIAKTK